jgi:hypothetical protein
VRELQYIKEQGWEFHVEIFEAGARLNNFQMQFVPQRKQKPSPLKRSTG